MGIFLILLSVKQPYILQSPTITLNDTSFSRKKGFVIIELFTSEGCSSCPPADKLINDIAAKAKMDSTNIFVLSEHVDYWNKIGWVDPFSSPFYSQRQTWYAKRFGEGNVYTPQVVVNGIFSFVGSDHQKLTKAIEEGLRATEFSYPIGISGNKSDIGNYNYDLGRTSKKYLLNCVLVQKQANSNVTSGENNGRLLFHTNVVKEWVIKENPPVTGNIQFKKTEGLTRDEFSIIAFIQDKDTREIVSAGILK